MAKITRNAGQTIFGSTPGANQIAQFGSLAASSPAFSTTPGNQTGAIQALSNWASGWFNAIIGANSPAIEDLNAFCFVMSYMSCYLMQTGIPEWDQFTTYYIGSVVNNGSGVLYTSLTNSNLNNALSSGTNWARVGWTAPTVQKFTTGTSATYTTPAGVLYIRVKMAGGGGGGAGSGTGVGGNSGGTGTSSSFGALIAGFGSRGTAGAGGAGGNYTLGIGSGLGVIGGQGSDGAVSTSTSQFETGGPGGNNALGGGGAAAASTGYAGAANTGAGGGGAGSSNVSACATGGGGGAGAYVEVLIDNPASTYTYTVGPGGVGGTAGTSGQTGGAGAAGIIIVEEFYQ